MNGPWALTITIKLELPIWKASTLMYVMIKLEWPIMGMGIMGMADHDKIGIFQFGRQPAVHLCTSLLFYHVGF
jgi:hypothetical protein